MCMCVRTCLHACVCGFAYVPVCVWVHMPPQVMTMMFEVQDLAVASPATVSRCGMVYLEPSILGLAPFTDCWLRTIPACIQPYSEQLSSLFSRFLEVTRPLPSPSC